MDEILIRPLRREERGQAAPLLFRSQQAALRQNGLVLAAFCGDTVCGAAGALPADDARVPAWAGDVVRSINGRKYVVFPW